MPTVTTASWTENVSLVASQVLAGGASDTDDIDLSVNGYDRVVVQWKGLFSATAASGCTISVLNSPDSGTSEDTVALYSFEVSVDAGNVVRTSFVIDGIPYAAIKRQNKDATYDIHGEVLTYAGRKWSSA